ncbi:hypothetical protein SAMN05660484_00011 [Eubacterium ruminantium]|uniref:hypothetical protein n=1 Tax=Eubacterium ruminantium TaxID=42322 RepID=UPI0008712C1E|nr:hypothetical protein [Eubacterium ruminantium]SCW26526.1 hypothetical protein SAMN05660484_00011 [Eubacterium ruminantium]SDM16097.1 hypothetical protein SAMN04490370_101236 [Eubacterium ruminantium]
MEEIIIEYHTGFPQQVGWYDVLVDGLEDRLLHRYCQMYGRHEWKDINGCKVDREVLWTGTAEPCP